MFKIPPVCVWGTLLDTKLFQAATKIESDVNYGLHLAASKIDKLSSDSKKSKEERKEEKVKTPKAKENTGNDKPVKSEMPEDVVEASTVKVEEDGPVKGVTYDGPVEVGDGIKMDFSSFTAGDVIDVNSSELTPVPEEDKN